MASKPYCPLSYWISFPSSQSPLLPKVPGLTLPMGTPVHFRKPKRGIKSSRAMARCEAAAAVQLVSEHSCRLSLSEHPGGSTQLPESSQQTPVLGPAAMTEPCQGASTHLTSHYSHVGCSQQFLPESVSKAPPPHGARDQPALGGPQNLGQNPGGVTEW